MLEIAQLFVSSVGMMVCLVSALRGEDLMTAVGCGIFFIFLWVYSIKWICCEVGV